MKRHSILAQQYACKIKGAGTSESPKWCTPTSFYYVLINANMHAQSTWLAHFCHMNVIHSTCTSIQYLCVWCQRRLAICMGTNLARQSVTNFLSQDWCTRTCNQMSLKTCHFDMWRLAALIEHTLAQVTTNISKNKRQISYQY